MASRQRTRIPEATWERHKETIRRLYLDEDKPLRGPDGIIEILKRQRNFDASKSQYETRFQRWGFQQNANRKDWMALDKFLLSREQESKESVVYLYDKMLKKERLQKQRLRYRETNNDVAGIIEPPKLPSLFRVQTPPLPSRDDDNIHSTGDQIHSIASAPQDILEGDRVPALPWSLQASNDDSIIPRLNISDNEELNQLAPFLSYQHSYQDWESFAEVSYPAPLFDSLNTFTDIENSFALPNGIFNALELERPFVPDWIKSSTAIPFDINGSSGILSMLRGLNINMFTFARTLINQLEVPLFVGFETELQLYLPRHVSNELCTQGNEVQFVGLLVSLLLNNALPFKALADPQRPHEILLRKALSYLHSLQTEDLTRLLNTLPSIARDAFKNGLFCSAIEFGAHEAVKRLCESGIDPNSVRLFIDDAIHTPLKRASELLHVEVVHTLIGFGADVTSRIEELSKACLGRPEETATVPVEALEILRILLKASGGLALGELTGLKYYRDPQVLETVRQYLRPEGWDAFISINYYNMFKNFGPIIPELLWLVHEHFEDIRQILGFEGFFESCVVAAFESNDATFIKFSLQSGKFSNPRFFACAAKYDVLPAVLHFLDIGLDPLDPREYPLWEAVENNSHRTLQTFRQRGIFDRLSSNSKALDVALAGSLVAENEEMVQDMLSHRKLHGVVEPGRFAGNRLNSLEAAILKNRLDIMDVLIEWGALPANCNLSSVPDESKLEILHILLDSTSADSTPSIKALTSPVQSKADLFRCLLSFDEFVTSTNFSSQRMRWLSEDPVHMSTLATAIFHRHNDLYERLVREGVPIDLNLSTTRGSPYSQNVSPLCAAVHKNEIGILQDLLERGANPWDDLALLEASRTHNTSAAKLIISAYSKRYPNKMRGFGCQGICEAVQQSDIDMIAILAPETDCNTITLWADRKSSAIGCAILNKSREGVNILSTLLRNGGNANNIVKGSGMRGTTALLLAIDGHSTEKIKILIEAGAKVDLLSYISDCNFTPLQYAVYLGSTNIVCYLLSQGASATELPNPWSDRTSLQFAAGRGFIGIATILIDAGANVNAPRCHINGRTAFEAAAENGRFDMLKFLMQKGVDLISDEGNQYRRAVELAEANRHLSAKALIEVLYATAQYNARTQALEIDYGLSEETTMPF